MRSRVAAMPAGLRVILGLALLGVVLGPRAAADTSPGHDAIIGGSPDTGDPGVVALVSNAAYLCSGTAVAPRVIVTAAHCLLPAPPDHIVIGPTPTSERRIRVLDHRARNTFDRETAADDVAVLFVEEVVDGDPWPVLQTFDGTPAGTSIRIVGYGRSHPDDMSASLKRQGTAVIDAVDERTFRFHASPSQTCTGDSGGRAFVMVDGIEYLAGITSRGDPRCADFAIDSRADVHLTDFIGPYLDAVAARGVEVGERCFEDANCASGSCIAAADLPTFRYCTAPCEGHTDCPPTMACTSGTCRRLEPSPGSDGTPCQLDGDCADGLGLCASFDGGVTSTCASACSPLDGDGACPDGTECRHVPGERVAFACAPVAGGCSVTSSGTSAGLAMIIALLMGVRWRRAKPWLRRHAHLLIAIMLLSTHAGLLVQGARQSSVTVDEAAHLAAGVYHWHSGNLSVYRVNPPLVRMIGALPVVVAGAELPAKEPRDFVASRPEGAYAQRFAEANRDDYHQLVFLARLPGILWSLLGALIVYVWARELFGRRGALIGLGLWCLEPNLIAHAQLLTPDLPATVAGLAATYACWRYLRAPSRKRAVLAGLVLGIAQLTKFTLLILYPIVIVLWLACHAGRLRGSVAHVALSLAVSVVILNAGYGFQGTATRLGDITFVSESFTGDHRSARDRAAARHIVKPGNRFDGTWLGSLPLPVPVDYIRGIDLQRRDFEKGLRSYLRGTWQDGGWWYYYLYALSVKLPLGVIALVLWGAAGWARRARTEWRDQLAIVVPALAILTFVSMQTGFTHHLRYVLPAFPFLILLASRVGAAARGRLGTVALAGLLGWTAVSSLRVQPHSLAYFNELAGGPEAGAEHLIDSNLDWGQDLLRLRDWLGAHPRPDRLRLAYFGAIDPELIDIEYTLPPGGLAALEPGRYAMSVNYVHGLRYRAFDGSKRIRVVEPDDYTHFQRLRPTERIGASILVYDVTEADLASLRGEHEARTP